MIITEKQINQLLIVAHAHMANMSMLGQNEGVKEVQKLIAQIASQQSEELKAVE